jgi:hypothetical protein
MDRWLERALEAEEALEVANERIADLTARIKSALNAEPESASRALSWIGRAQNAEKLLMEIVRKGNLTDGVFPRELRTRIEAQLKTVEILRRDQEALGERPPGEEWWETWRATDDGTDLGPEKTWMPSILRTTKDGP